MPRLTVDTIVIRDALIDAIESDDSGLFADAEVQRDFRNSLCLQLKEGGTIYTVTVAVGGALRR